VFGEQFLTLQVAGVSFSLDPATVLTKHKYKGVLLMRFVEPKVFLVGETASVEDGVQAYLNHVGAPEWSSDAETAVELLPEMYGRLCYRSWKPGLNPNVVRVRKGNEAYLGHVLEVRHGSVVEHPVVNFIFADVSRVFTHELVRHRVGTAMSQESLRFVRLEDIAFWFPEWAREDEELLARSVNLIQQMEEHQIWMAQHFDLDHPKKGMNEKKMKTSFMRRLAPDGLATTIGWSANPRTIRFCLEQRTDPGAEEEIRKVFGMVGEIVTARYPNLFGDYVVNMVDGLPHYTTPNRKV
jgi:thymidylate synthase (FAD)